MKLRIVMLLIAMIMISASVQSSSLSEDKFVIIGLGVLPCTEWNELRAYEELSVDNYLISWVQGYLSGLNNGRAYFSGVDRVILPNPVKLYSYMDEACLSYPSELVSTFVNDLFFELLER